MERGRTLIRRITKDQRVLIRGNQRDPRLSAAYLVESLPWQIASLSITIRVSTYSILCTEVNTMAKHGTYDAIIIGGGHNGLVAAAYLAKAGRKVCVLERRHVLGGCATTEELWPGYKVSTAAYVISLFQTQIIQELALKEYGLKILPQVSFFVHATARRPQLVDGARSRRSTNAKSASSACATRRPIRVTKPCWNVSRRRSSRCSAKPLPIPCPCRRIGDTSASARSSATARKYFRLLSATKALGADLPEAVELLTGAARPILGALVRIGRVAGHAGDRCDHRRVRSASAHRGARMCCSIT